MRFIKDFLILFVAVGLFFAAYLWRSSFIAKSASDPAPAPDLEPAVVCQNSVTGLNALTGGLDMSEWIGKIGDESSSTPGNFDVNSYFSVLEHLSPAPSYQLGLEAMKMLRLLIEGKKPPHRQIILPTSLVIRKSCGCW